MSFSSSLIAGTKAYQGQLEAKVSASGGGWGAAFSASADFKKMETTSKAHSTFYTMTEVNCCAYTASVHSYSSPELSDNFKSGLDSLPAEYNEEDYLRFIRNFGTHHIKSADMGALYGQQSSISKENWSKMVGNGVNIGASAGYSGLFSVSASAMYDNQKKEAEDFKKETQEQKIYSLGKVPPANGDSFEWMARVTEEPQPQRLRLAPLDEMTELKKYLGQKPNGQKVLDNLSRALGQYCLHLQKMNSISSCAAPDPDPAFPIPEPVGLLFPGRWGEWGRTEYCGGAAYKGYAVNFELRIESNQGGGSGGAHDDTALNSICLNCNTGETICSKEGSWGGWYSADGCNKGFTEAQLQWEADQGDGDDSAANDLKLKCSNGDWLGVYGPGPGWGTWTTKKCQEGQVICGLRTKVDPWDDQSGHKDDTSLNGVELKCCLRHLIN